MGRTKDELWFRFLAAARNPIIHSLQTGYEADTASC